MQDRWARDLGRCILATLAAAALLAGCSSKGDGGGTSTGGPATSAPASANTTAAAPGTGGQFAAGTGAPQAGGGFKPVFPRAAIKPLSGCTQEAYVMLDAAGKGSRTAAMLLQPLRMIHLETFRPADGYAEVRSFTVSAGEPEAAPETIVAHCGTPDTCNEIAAYLAHARIFPKPQLFCGKPTIFGTYDSAVAGFNKPIIPDKDEAENLCARVAGCRYDADPTLPPHLFNDCAKAPTKYKALCGTEKTCEAVLACVAK